ncbi:MAG: TolC family protein [Opitutae bacterium]|nr:TolC family protein [Opitutae bacterium]
MLALSAMALAQPAAAPAPAPGRVEKLTLNDAIRRALAKNFSIKVSSFDASISAARLTEALGKFDPVLAGTYTHLESENPQLFNSTTGLRPNATGSESDTYNLSLNGLLPTGLTYQLGATSTNARGTFNSFADNYATFAGVSGQQPLLRDAGFGPTLASVRIAKTNRQISDWQFKQTIIDTITRVIFAYNDLNFAHANLRSARRSRELAAGLLDDNEKRYRIGSMSEYDVTSARSRLVSREEGILFAERAVLDSENFLKQLITDENDPALLSLHLEIEPPPPAPVVVVDPATDFREALKKRPDYQQALLNVERNGLNFRLQRNQLLPRVDLVGSYGYSGNDTSFGVSRQQVRGEDFRSFSYGAVVSVPLTFTTERGRYRAARLQLRQAETSLQSLEQDIVVRVGNAAGQIETTRKRVETAGRARELAQKTLDAEVKRLRAGTGSTFFVAQQQEILSELETREYRAQSDYRKALAEYDRQLGLTLEKMNISVISPAAK